MTRLQIYLTLFILIFIFNSVNAAELMINVDNRTSMSLNGKWNIIIDPYETGYYDYRYQPSQNGFFKNQQPKDKWDRIEYSFDSDRMLHVPGDWNSQDNMLFFYEGTVWYKKSLLIDDPFGEFVDVLGCNEYLGWYDGLPQKCNQIEWRTRYNKPVIISEFGAGALYGYHGDELSRWTEEFQKSVYEHNIEMLKKVPFIRGMSPWILKDFRSPRRLLPRIQDYWNRKGLVSDEGHKKKAFDVLKAYYEQVEKNYK